MQNKQVKKIYKKPIVEIVSFMVEQGFAGSDGNGNQQQIDQTVNAPAVASENLNQREAFSNSSFSYDGF